MGLYIGGGGGVLGLSPFCFFCLIVVLVFAFLFVVYIHLVMLLEDLKGKLLPLWSVPLLSLIAIVFLGLAGLSCLLN